MDTNAQAQQMLADLVNNGGGTYVRATLDPFRPVAGYAVAVGGAILPEEQVTADSIVWVARAVSAEHMTDYVGTWLNEGKVYIDAVRFVSDLGIAISIGREHGQIAVWDFANSKEVTL